MGGFDFGVALSVLRGGGRVCRSGWNGKGMWLSLVGSWNGTGVAPLSGDFRMLPFIAMKTADNGIVPWLASQTDVLASDWHKC